MVFISSSNSRSRVVDGHMTTRQPPCHVTDNFTCLTEERSTFWHYSHPSCYDSSIQRSKCVFNAYGPRNTIAQDYSFNWGVPRNSAPQLDRASLPVSLILVWKITLFPSFHISVISVCPGSTVPANRTLMFLNSP